MLSSVSYADKATSQKAADFLKSLQGLWKKEIWAITALRFTGILAFNLQLIIIAELVSSLALKKSGAIDSYRLLAWLGLCAIARALFNYLSDLKAAAVTEKVTVGIRSEIMNDIHKGYIAKFRNQYSAGISLSFLNKTEVISPYFTRYIPQMLLCVIAPLSVLIYLATINWVCALLVLFCAPAIPLFMMIIGKGTEAKSREQWENLSKMGSYFFDRLQGITTLYLFNQLKRQSDQVRIFSKEYGRLVIGVLKLAFLSSAVLEFFSAIIIAGCAVFIGLNMIHYIHYGPDGGTSLKNGLIILLLIPEFFIALKTLGNFYHDRAQALGAVISLQECGFFQAPVLKEEINQGNNEETLAVSGETHLDGYQALPIIFKDVNFAYPGGPDLFSSFNLLIRPCEKIKISGANGSGKTTLIELILGWQIPCSGQILIGDRLVEKIGEAELFNEISLINQQTSIFQGTIRSNILMGRSLPEKDLFQQVLEPVSLISLLERLPDGLDTRVAEDGKSISGGERQKIALARALVKRSPIIILDEPFTHLDPASVASFISILNKISPQKTIIITGHGEAYQALQGYREIKL
ncbi:ABC transporter ATP-binding protein/permease [Mucilaginibacter sp. McL0603]|uniref:ABC transporter ATP-binding protein/permease n=1 Tax=Mucilaginibacter sp. McL0603 TaxID=3415670 RepID=UPI003CEB435B